MLTNYDDKYVIMTCGFLAGAMCKYLKLVQLYDIERDVWSALPKRIHDTANHKGVCVDGKLFLFFARDK